MEVEVYEDGVPSWVDVMVPDPEAVSAFYAGLFGWDVVAGPPEAGGYRQAYLRGRTVAGIGGPPPPGAPPVWTTYVNVDDAEATAAKVTAAGGTVLMGPMDVMGFGRMVVCADPQGAVFGLWQPGSHKGAGIVNESNTLVWNELMTPDVEAAKTFYAAVFGWGAQTDPSVPPAGYTVWTLGERQVGGMMPLPPDAGAMPPVWTTYFAVEDLDAALAKVAELGGRVVRGRTPTMAGPFAVVLDSQGAAFCVMEMAQG